MRQDQIERICRLTPLQDGMFFEALRKQGSSEVIYQVCLEMHGDVRPGLLREAWRSAVRRHPSLRTSFHYERLDYPLQVARRDADPPWREHDWRTLSPAEVDAELQDLVAADRRVPFELTNAPLMRLTLVRGPGDRSWLVWTYHHLLLDGWSTYLVLNDVSRGYRDLTAGREPAAPAPRPYWEYVAWLQGRDDAGAERFWREQLRGLRGPTPLGYEDVPAGTATEEEFAEIAMTLPVEVAAGLEEISRRSRITLGTLLNAAWAVTLSRYSGSDDVVFGGIVSGRTPDFAGIDELVGLFINVLPVRTRLRPDQPLREWLDEFQRQLADARQFDYTPLSVVQRYSELPRGVPLFESLAVFINYPVRERWTDAGDLQVTGTRVLQQPHYPLHLTGTAGSLGWRLTLAYDPARFSRTTVSRLGDLLTAVLAAMAARPGQRLEELPGWTATPPLSALVATGQPPLTAVGELLAASAVRDADATAVHAGNPDGGSERIEYRRLLAEATALARRLAEMGSGPATPVAVRCRPQPSLAVAALAALMAGAPVLALHPEVDADTAATLTAAGVRVLLDPGPTGPDWERACAAAGAALVPVVATAPAGSGAPRPVAAHGPALLVPHAHDPGGAVLRHTDLGQLLWWLQDALPLRAADRVHLSGPPHVLIRDLLWVLAAGATAVLGAPDQKVTVAHRLPANLTGTQPTRRLLVRGVLPMAAYRSAAAAGVELVEEHLADLGGTALVSPRWPEPRGCAAPARVRGAARAFPVAGAAPHRPEPDDPRLWSVAAVLCRHSGIADALTRVVPLDGGQGQVVAYVVPATGPEVRPASVAELCELVAAWLPAELVPQTFVTLDRIPRTSGGEVEWVALPTPAGGQPAEPVRGGDPIAELIAAIWAEALDRRLDELTPDSSFFDLGGHSLLAIRLVSRIRANLGVEFSLNHLFATPTVAGVSAVVRRLLTDGSGASDEEIPLLPRDQPLAPSFAQERLWFIDQLDGPANNVMLPTRFRDHIDPGTMRVALRGLLQRHELLRTCLPQHDGVTVQEIRHGVEPPFAYDDLSDRPLDVAERLTRQMLEEDVARRFDLAAEIPIRARLVRLAPGDHVLGVCVHHIAFDGWSTGVLARDLGELYEAARDGRPPPLPTLTAQYADFAGWQRERLRGEQLTALTKYWRGELDGVPKELRLVSTPARPAGDRTGAGGSIACEIPGDLAEAVRTLALGEASTPFMVLLAAYGVQLSRRTGREDVVVGSPVAGRDRPALEPLIGMFVNTLVLRLRLDGRPTFRELLTRVRHICLGALAHRDLPFERLVSVVSPHRSVDRMPLVQVSFNLQSAPAPEFGTGAANAAYFPVRQDVPRFELMTELYDWAGGMRCVFHYAEDIYDRGFVERLAEEYVDLVRTLVAAADQPVPLHGRGDTGAAEADQSMVEASRSLLRAMSR